MIHSLKGTILNVEDGHLYLVVGGINFDLMIARPEAFDTGKEVEVYAHMHWNQDNGPSLFGFSSAAEKQIFTLAISCSGIGPKMGLAVLAQFSPAEFVQAVQAQDIKAISSVSGIGPKKAEQVALQLKHKVEKVVDFVAATDSSVDLKGIKQLREVLTSLNYSSPEINSAVEYARANSGNANFDNLLRKALGFLSKSI
jgi:holliday junction DNA helicase RuvA